MNRWRVVTFPHYALLLYIDYSNKLQEHSENCQLFVLYIQVCMTQSKVKGFGFSWPI